MAEQKNNEKGPVSLKEEPAQQEQQSDVDSTPSVGEAGGWGAYFRIFSYATRFEIALQSLSALCAVASGSGVALQTLIFGAFITSITKFASGDKEPPEFRRETSRLALYFVILGIGRAVLGYTYNTLLTYCSYRISRNIRRAYIKSALCQEVAFYDLGSGGSIATQATSNGKLISKGIAEKMGLTIQGISVFVTAFIVAFVTNWKLTLIICCIAPATILVMGVVAGIEAGYETKILEVYAQANSFAEGVIASARTVHAFEMRSRLVNKFDKYLDEAHGWGKKISPLLGFLFSAEYTIIYLGFGLAFWQGVRMLARGEIDDPGDIFTVLMAVTLGSINITMLAPHSIDFTRAAAAAGQLFVLIDRQSDINPLDKSGEQPSETIGHVELENVSFSYPTRPGITVLDDFTLNVPAGKVTALVGQSGSGKSTIIGLIERWYRPTSGSIKLDGRSLDQLNINWLRKHVRLVQQEPILFQGSVFDNIAYGLVGTEWENASREERMTQVREAAQLAYADEFISGLPNGYDTEIGQRGGLLSGGQKQRVAIARAVVSRPKVLLLDEATSALDPHAEEVVQKALDQASKGRTTIVIAHKLATIRKADNIVVMTKGQIVEQGSHEALIAQDGTYARLVKIQNLSVSAEEEAEESTSENEDKDEAEQVCADPADLTKTLTRFETADRARLEAQKDRDSYENHKHLGFVGVIWRLVRENPELKWVYMITLIACVLGAGAIPGQALLLSNTVEVFTLTGQKMEDEGSYYARMFIVLAAGCLVAYFTVGMATNTIAQALSHKLRRQSLEDIMRQDLQFFDRPENSIGALTSRVDSNPQAILELMGFNVGLILIGMLNITICSVLGLAHSWKLGLVVVFAGLPPMVGSGWLKIRSNAKLEEDNDKRTSNSAAIASEAVTAIRTVSSLAIEEKVLDRYVSELDLSISGAVRPLCLMMLWFALTQSMEYYFMALGFWWGCRLLSFGEVTMYNFFVTFMAVFFSGQATSELFQFSTSLTNGKNAANYIFWLHELQPTVEENSHNKDNAPKSGGPIDIDSIRFSYPLRPDATVLRGIDLHIKEGQFVALVGASGCGKSTMIAMLERFYDPSTGSISISGEALTNLNPRLYRRIVSLVQQEPTLFQGTIRENIALGIDDPDAATPETSPSSPTNSTTVPEADIEAALRAANAWDFVCSLPEGVHTPAGANGTQLSGGQRQRIAIARALIRNPRILLLDEATSALDTESEKLVQGVLAEAAKKGDRITVAVAHRLSTIKDADVICVFYGGKIVEMGTHEELVAKRGIYRKMCEAQSLD
ncbi:unnamed protein product [Clonostachys chloroleuca]|uniref:Uncharacterized protein n=1 Tax=Clonostachys chloroleuca TaxID=1926264 RepID=A0AA35MAQ0_9HYPO|nr:unnamed protein product [Clonostachys chloroleuca]